MNSSRNCELLELYKSPQTVFTFNTVLMMCGAKGVASLVAKLNYNVRAGRLLNPRRGIYAKQNYKVEELCGQLYTPSYISLEYVLQRAGVVFQFDSSVTAVSYVSRTIEIDGNTLQYHRVKNSILGATDGIANYNGYSMASPERAFLDVMYLNKEYYFDNLNPLQYSKIKALLPLYGSKTLEKRVNLLFKK